ncbi:MAG: hypothetical protein PHF37_09680 [Phycisphaerae bacterium]|nr:hypothetical protein [Phycisphaerae bacterium]
MPDPRYFRQVSPLPTAGNAAEVDVRAMSAPLRELGNIGNTMTNVGLDAMRQNKEAEYYDQLNNAKLVSLQADQKWVKERDTLTDTSTWEEALRKRQTEVAPKFTNTKAQNDYGIWKQEHDIGQQNETLSHKSSVDARNYQTNYNAQTALLTDAIVNATTEQDAQIHRNELANLSGYHYNEKGQLEENNGPRNPLWHDPATMKLMIEKQTADAEAARQKYLGEQRYAAASEKVAVLAKSDMTKDAFSKTFDTDPAFTGIKRTGDNSLESLSRDFDWWKDFYKGQDDKSWLAKDLKATQDFAKMLSGKTDAPLTANIVTRAYPTNSADDTANRANWLAIQKNSNAKDLALETTSNGQSAVMSILINANKGEQTTQESIKSLLKHRYIDKDISQKTLDWAMNKMDNPYPATIAAHLGTTMAAVKQSITGRWERDTDIEETTSVNNAIMQNVNESLLNWVDSEIAAGRTPKAADIYTEAKQLEAGAKTSAADMDLMKRHLSNEKKLAAKQAEAKIADRDLMKRHLQNERKLVLRSQAARPQTQAEYDALPSGTVYLDTDGKIKRKR